MPLYDLPLMLNSYQSPIILYFNGIEVTQYHSPAYIGYVREDDLPDCLNCLQCGTVMAYSKNAHGARLCSRACIRTRRALDRKPTSQPRQIPRVTLTGRFAR